MRTCSESVLNRHKRGQIGTKTYIPCCFSITIPLGLLFIHQHMVISTLAIIANRDQISTYILQVTRNHLTSTELSKAKHIFDPGPTKDSRYICLDKESICSKWFQSTLST